MPKRRRNGSNPLADARRGVGVASSGKTDKTSRDIQKKTNDLWHRKSGAGYNLFIQYYGSQPHGVVSFENDDEGRNDNICLSSTGGVQAKTGAGMSRASKKRQKKKAKASGSDDVGGTKLVAMESGIPSSFLASQKANNSSNEHHHAQVPESHPLVQALASHSKYQHLSSFVNTLATPLPLTFRMRKNTSSSSKELEEILANTYSNHIAPVSFDPSKAIYQSSKSSSLSKSNLAKIPDLKELIIKASMDGTLARQEIGSMLPVYALSSVDAITNGSKVLDLCASPGSKTLQAVEIVAETGKKGKVIANDVHSGRLDSLREAVARSGLSERLTSRVTFTNYDASIFPPPKSGKLFDAIICDVPCSGDGTIRKDKHILPMWTPGTGNELHSLQVKILKRALELVKVGGVVCYSTCSLNPVEDEAVVAAAIQNKTNMEFELMEWPKKLFPGFIRRQGVEDWNVGFYDHNKVEEGTDDYGSIIFCRDETHAADASIDAAVSLWPTKLNIQEIHLDRCVRLLPQDNDTGGFFLVLIKRLK
jgi:16S rRNA C967 or C1407 C5-methylase (RsmB/RsmF family)